MKSVFILGLLVLCVSASANVVYKTIKEDGTVVYTDTPSPRSTQVNLSAVNSVVAPALNDASRKKPPTKKTSKRQDVAKNYQVTIVSPVHEAHVRNNAGNVTIAAKVTPNAAGMFQLIMDNQVLNTQSQHIFELNNVDRGEHTIQINYLDKSGKILASSESQVFYLHKASALITTR